MSVKVELTGSNRELRTSPWNGSYASVPPFTSGRPSGKTTIPLQNMSQPTGCVVIVPDCGSQTAAWKFVFAATFPDPDTINTRPSFVSAACTGLIGICVDRVCHVPCRAGWARTAGTYATAAARAARRDAVKDQRIAVIGDFTMTVASLPRRKGKERAG